LLIRNRDSALDLKISISIILAVIFFVEVSGDNLFIGSWYYAITLFAGLVLGTVFYPKPFFLCGVISALVFSLWLYVQHNVSSVRPEGLLVLGHMFSLPGAFLGLIISALIIKNIHTSHAMTFTLSVIGVLVGFFINQAIVCSTLMHCRY
jgi:hypothetical protein